jgi:hypothetical protein
MKTGMIFASILAIGLIGLGMFVYIPGKANADTIEHTRLLQYTGEDHEQSTGDHCDLKYVQSPWDTNSIEVDENDQDNVYLYARCRAWNNNNWSGNPPGTAPAHEWHNKSIVQYDVWFFLNDPDCSGPAEAYWTGTITVNNSDAIRAKRITPWHLYYDVEEGDQLTIKWELNTLARQVDDQIMDSTWTRVTVHINVVDNE